MKLQIESKILLFFGAGASYGVGGTNTKPPLGNQLFDQLYKKFPRTWGTLGQSNEKIFHENFELGMETIYGKQDNMAELLKDMGIFFSKFNIENTSQNLYYGIIQNFQNDLIRGNLIVSTLNYDCLLELAILHFHEKILYWGVGEGIRLLKIHGSCNFIPVGATGKGKVIMNQSTTRCNINIIHPNDVENILEDIPLPPAMSLYAKGKKRIIAPDQIDQIVKEFQQVIQESSTIIIVGVNPNPDDTYIWNYLRDFPGTIYYIGNQVSWMNWKNKNRIDKPSIWISDSFFRGYNNIIEIISRGLL